jgi:hypothetical protein
MQTIYVKVTNPDLPEPVRTWFASTPLTKKTPEAQVEFLNRTAKNRGINATYELATTEEYWAYRRSA